MGRLSGKDGPARVHREENDEAKMTNAPACDRDARQGKSFKRWGRLREDGRQKSAIWSLSKQTKGRKKERKTEQQ